MALAGTRLQMGPSTMGSSRTTCSMDTGSSFIPQAQSTLAAGTGVRRMERARTNTRRGMSTMGSTTQGSCTVRARISTSAERRSTVSSTTASRWASSPSLKHQSRLKVRRRSGGAAMSATRESATSTTRSTARECVGTRMVMCTKARGSAIRSKAKAGISTPMATSTRALSWRVSSMDMVCTITSPRSVTRGLTRGGRWRAWVNIYTTTSPSILGCSPII
mmetsp:Transcript_7892/g.17194  ORF Transcript_7892/g.17194 Transcript_7892/m.17194 type:complete len:220 (+) Transcript_7892:697-1356(+)